MKITDRKPALFEKSDHNIWTDAHIQRQLLKQHLDSQSDGASRRPESIAKIVDFILRHGKPRSRLLDLGCGPGLYTSLLADEQYSVTGIDFNEASIGYAAAKRKDIKYISGDYITDFPAGKYDVVVMIYCDLGTHPDDDRDRLLENIYRSLEDGGEFIFDIFPEEIVRDRAEGKHWEYAPSGGFWDESEYLLLSRTFHYPENKAFAEHYHLIVGREVRQFIIWERYYSEKEITELLQRVGFRKISIHKDLLRSNNFTSSREMFIVAEK